MIRVTVTRKGSFLDNLARISKVLGRRAEATTRQVAQDVYKESQRLVPVDTGALRRSGKVSQIGSLLQASFVVAYGGKDYGAEPRTWSSKEGRYVTRYPYSYVVYVHEDPTKRHDFPTSYKFLERAIKAVKSRGKAAISPVVIDSST